MMERWHIQSRWTELAKVRGKTWVMCSLSKASSTVWVWCLEQLRHVTNHLADDESWSDFSFFFPPPKYHCTIFLVGVCVAVQLLNTSSSNLITDDSPSVQLALCSNQKRFPWKLSFRETSLLILMESWNGWTTDLLADEQQCVSVIISHALFHLLLAQLYNWKSARVETRRVRGQGAKGRF